MTKQEAFIDELIKLSESEDKKLNPLLNFALGAAGGAGSGVITYPLEAIGGVQANQGSSFINAAKTLMAGGSSGKGVKGWKGLYAGMPTKLSRGTIGQALNMGIVLGLQSALINKIND